MLLFSISLFFLVLTRDTAAINTQSTIVATDWSNCSATSTYQTRSLGCESQTTLYLSASGVCQPPSVRPCAPTPEETYCSSFNTIDICLISGLCGWCIDNPPYSDTVRASTTSPLSMSLTYGRGSFGHCVPGSPYGPKKSPLCQNALWITKTTTFFSNYQILEVDSKGETIFTSCSVNILLWAGIALVIIFVLGTSCLMWSAVKNKKQIQADNDEINQKKQDQETFLFNPLIMPRTGHLYRALSSVIPEKYKTGPRVESWLQTLRDQVSVFFDCKELFVFEITTLFWLSDSNSESFYVNGAGNNFALLFAFGLVLVICVMLTTMIDEIRARKVLYYALLQQGVILQFENVPILWRSRFQAVCVIAVVIFGFGFQKCDYHTDWTGITTLAAVIYFAYQTISFEETLLPWNKVLEQPANVGHVTHGWDLEIISETTIALYLLHRRRQNSSRHQFRQAALVEMLKIEFPTEHITQDMVHSIMYACREVMILSRADIVHFKNNEINEDVRSLNFDWAMYTWPQDSITVAESSTSPVTGVNGASTQSSARSSVNSEDYESIVIREPRTVPVPAAATTFTILTAYFNFLRHPNFRWIQKYGKDGLPWGRKYQMWMDWNHYATRARSNFFIGYSFSHDSGVTGDLNDFNHSIQQGAEIAFPVHSRKSVEKTCCCIERDTNRQKHINLSRWLAKLRKAGQDTSNGQTLDQRPVQQQMQAFDPVTNFQNAQNNQAPPTQPLFIVRTKSQVAPVVS